MSSSEVPTTTAAESTAQADTTAEQAPITTPQVTEPATVAASTVADQPTEVSPPVEESDPPAPTEDAKTEDDKKEKKTSRKPFADLISKILKPHPHDKPVSDKKEPTEGPAVTPEVVAPAATLDTPVEAAATAADTTAETPAVEEPNKDASSPRKERANIFEKLTALVMKPKSPKPKRVDATKEEGDANPAVEPSAEPLTSADASLPPPAVSPAADLPEVSATDAPAVAETPEEPKSDRKEKSPKDLAKLARRFSGRLFGMEKKKDNVKRAEPTPEETEEAPQMEAPAADAEASDAAPQISAAAPVESSTETAQQPSDSVPVIAATA